MFYPRTIATTPPVPGLPGGSELPAGENLSALRMVSRQGSQYFLSDPSSDLSVLAIAGLVTSATSLGVMVQPLGYGEYEDLFWNWAAGLSIFLGPQGILTQLPPTSGWRQVVARPLNSTTIAIQIEGLIRL